MLRKIRFMVFWGFLGFGCLLGIDYVGLMSYWRLADREAFHATCGYPSGGAIGFEGAAFVFLFAVLAFLLSWTDPLGDLPKWT